MTIRDGLGQAWMWFSILFVAGGMLCIVGHALLGLVSRPAAYRLEGNITAGWRVYERAWWGWRKIGARSHMDQALRDLVPDKETGFSKLLDAAKRGER